MQPIRQPATAEIIPFPGLAAARMRRPGPRGTENGWTGRRDADRQAPVIEWGGSHYHEAAIAEEKRTSHS